MKAVAPQISSTGVVLDLNGNPIHGVNGFDPSASQSLGYVAAMQEHGVPVTYAYTSMRMIIMRPEAPMALGRVYVAQLKAYDQGLWRVLYCLARMASTRATRCPSSRRTKMTILLVVPEPVRP